MSRTSSSQRQQSSQNGGGGPSYYFDPESGQQQHSHLPPPHSMQHPESLGYHPEGSAYHDPRIYHSQFEHQPSGSGWQGDYPSAAGGPSRLPIPLPSRDLYAGYPPNQHGPQRSSPGIQPGTPRQPIEGWPGGQLNAPPHTMPPLLRQNPRQDPRSVSVKLEDLVSHDPRGGNNANKGPGGFTSVPLGPAPEPGGQVQQQQQQQQPPKSAGASTNGGPSGSGVAADAAGQAGPSEFIKKLYKMLEEESTTFGQGRGRMKKERGSVGWARGGSSFVVWDMNEFTTKILPQTFRHSNFSSFVRQLNKYGFSKIKHVDEETGQIRENIWEFQHPNFQAGGKADLETIKRKAVAPKKTDADTAQSPARPTMVEDGSRLQELESRVQGLEEQLAGALEDVRQARMREQGTAGLLREMLSHLSAAERGAAASSAGTPASDVEPSPHMMHMWQLYEQVASSTPIAQPSFGYTGFPPQQMQQQYPSYAHLAPLSGLANAATQALPSPSFEGRHLSRDKPTPPRRSSASDRPAVSFSLPATGDQRPSTSITSDQAVTGPPSGMPVYAETPAWLTEGVTAPMPMYHRKSSDGVAFKLMMDALGQGNRTGFGDETQDPLDVRPPSSEDQQGQGQAPFQSIGNNAFDQQPFQAQQPQQTSQPTLPGPIIQSSPFGTLLIPSESSVHPNAQKKGKTSPKSKSSKKSTNNTDISNGLTTRSRQSSIIKPHWNQTPSILVVEDDVVYRQLSSKFLEKFGCVVETVENAQEAIEKMNQTKYDLVLMDIFFGPSMDGRKATSLIRQFDMYTPIISMTSNAQPQDVDSYLQSGMNDILAKPFTKHGLFGILDKHLLHMKVLQLSAEVPRSVGVPPLSDQGVMEAVADGAATIRQGMWGEQGEMRNPLAAMGWSDDTYQIVLNQYLHSGMMPDITNINFYNGQPMITNTNTNTTTNTSNHSNTVINFDGSNGTNGSGSIGTNVVFGDFKNRKRSLELAADDGWGQAGGVTPMILNGHGQMEGGVAVGEVGQENAEKRQTGKKDNKRAKR